MFADGRRYFIDALSLCGYPLGHSQSVEMLNSSLVSGVTSLKNPFKILLRN